MLLLQQKIGVVPNFPKIKVQISTPIQVVAEEGFEPTTFGL